MKNALHKVAVASAGLLIALSTPAVWAISVSPGRTELRLPAGGEATAVFNVMNPHAEIYDVEISEKPWFIYPNNRTIHVEDWIKLPSKTQFRLKPGKSRDVTVRLKCPKDAVGELMGMVSFSYQGAQASMITSMISTPIYLQVMGTEKNTGEIVALGAGTRGGVFQVGARVKATGNMRLHPVGMIQLIDQQGVVKGDYTVPEATPIFPGQTHDCATQGPVSVPPAGRYTLRALLTSGSLELKAEKHIVVKANGDVDIEK